MTLSKNYVPGMWLAFITDYNPEHPSSDDLDILDEIQTDFSNVTKSLLYSAGYDMNQLALDNTHDTYNSFLAYCSWVGHGINLFTEYQGKIKKMLELDDLLSSSRVALAEHPNSNQYILTVRDVFQIFDNLVNTIEELIESTNRNSEDYDPAANFTSKLEDVHEAYNSEISSFLKERLNGKI